MTHKLARERKILGTKHVGVRREGANIWATPGREWECYDRATGSRIGDLHPTRWEACEYAEYRERTTFNADA